MRCSDLSRSTGRRWAADDDEIFELAGCRSVPLPALGSENDSLRPSGVLNFESMTLSVHHTGCERDNKCSVHFCRAKSGHTIAPQLIHQQSEDLLSL
jgi:hypothetical protein